MSKFAKVSVAVTDVSPQSDGSAECRIFFRVHLDVRSKAVPYFEVFPRVENARDVSLNDIEERAIEEAIGILSRIASEGADGLKRLRVEGIREDLAEQFGDQQENPN